jgi:Uma2 family endonuclease
MNPTSTFSDGAWIADFFATHPIRFGPDRPMSQDEFFDFCQRNPDMRFERTAQGELIVMPPSGGESGARDLSVGAQLYQWATARRSGRAFGSSTGFVLPSGANVSPDAAWLSPEQLAAISPEQMKKFLPVAPFFVVEVLSPSDSRKATKEKLVEYLNNGSRLGWFIDPERRQVNVYRPGRPVDVLEDPKTVSGDPELPGFVLDLDPVWNV